MASEKNQLEHEYEVYQLLAGGIGIPVIYWFRTESDFNAMVFDRLGPSLEDLFNRCNRKFSLKTVLLLADQLVRVIVTIESSNTYIAQISRIEYIHSRHFIHRDIKPANLLMGDAAHSNTVYIVDFGFANAYRDPKTRLHIPYKSDCAFTGTTLYASINNHRKAEQSRRDDLESLAYVLIYFLRGFLPWGGTVTRKQHQDKVIEKKAALPLDILCEGCPKAISTFLAYVRALGFGDKPNYAYLRQLLRDLSAREGYQYDDKYDWCMLASDDQSCGAAAGLKIMREDNKQRVQASTRV